MALSNLLVFETKREARRARRSGETVIKISGGYAVVSNAFYKVWKKSRG